MGHQISRCKATTTPDAPQGSSSLARQQSTTRKRKQDKHTACAVPTQPVQSLDDQQPEAIVATRPQPATLLHQQQFQTASSSGSVVITIRMLKMEPNDLKEFVQQHHMQQQQQQLRLNPTLRYEQHNLPHHRQLPAGTASHSQSNMSDYQNMGMSLDNRIGSTCVQLNCDKSNGNSMNDEQNGNWPMDDALHIEEQINRISLVGSDGSDRGMDGREVTNNNADLQVVGAAGGAEAVSNGEAQDSVADTSCAQCQPRRKSNKKWGRNTDKESKQKKSNWSLRFNCVKLKRSSPASPSTSSTCPNHAPTTASRSSGSPATTIQPLMNVDSVTELRSSMTESDANVAKLPPTTLLLENSPLCNGSNVILLSMNEQSPPLLDFTRCNADECPIEDCDKQARMQRALEIEEGVEPPPGFMPSSLMNANLTASEAAFLNSASLMSGPNAVSLSNPTHWHMVCSSDAALRLMIPNLMQHSDELPRIHSQYDYIHCLVPDLKRIISTPYYYGKMDRYEAERLLDGKPEGTFLLRDSAQEEFLFSVSFRKYGRSLHARIEQFNHKFSFDCHDPGVYTSTTVTGLLEHYKDPACVMFFEPALTLPLNRGNVFSLQQLSRATIVSHATYDGIDNLGLPKKLKTYLKEYHYKQRVRVKRFDDPYYSAS